MEKASAFLDLIGFDRMIDGRIKDHIGQLLMTFSTKDGEKLEEIAQQERPKKAAMIVARALQETRDAFRRKIVEVYAAHFSDEEFDALTAFYTSPTGQRLLEVGPPITVAITEASDAWSEDAMRAHEANLKEVLGDLLGGTPQ